MFGLATIGAVVVVEFSFGGGGVSLWGVCHVGMAMCQGYVIACDVE